MDLIVAADAAWNIGSEGGLLVHSPEDLAWFRAQTKGRILLYGRLTLTSFPGGKPLPHRRNLVLSRQPDLKVEGAEVWHSPEDIVRSLSQEEWDRVMLIGGGQVYRTFLPYCRTAYVTRFAHIFPADTTFPNLDREPGWQLEDQTEWHVDKLSGVRYRFCIYRQYAPKQREEG